MKTSLIIGVSGQDGAYLANLLLSKSYRVVGTSRDAQVSSFDNLGRLGIKNDVQTLSMSLNDFRSVIQIITKIQPDEIYNLAGQTSVGLSFEQPVETFESIGIGTLNLLECLRFLGTTTRLYNAGSSECFGNTNGQSADELTPFRPRSPYALAKSAAFWAVSNYREAYNLYACSGILFNHESMLRPEREKLMLGNVDIQRDWGWAPEYVDAMWRMLQQNTPDDYVIATGETHSLLDFVKTAFSYLGLDWKKHVQTDSNLLRPTEIMVSRANPEKAYEKLSWKARYAMTDVANG